MSLYSRFEELSERSSWLSSGTVTGSQLDQAVGGRIWLTRPFSICYRKIPPAFPVDPNCSQWRTGYGPDGITVLSGEDMSTYIPQSAESLLFFSFDHDSLISSLWQWPFIQKDLPNCSGI